LSIIFWELAKTPGFSQKERKISVLLYLDKHVPLVASTPTSGTPAQKKRSLHAGF